MVKVSAIDTYKRLVEIRKEAIGDAEAHKLEYEDLIKNKVGEVVKVRDVHYQKNAKKNTEIKYGFYMDGYLKHNIDNFLIKAVQNKWDGNILCLSGDTVIQTINGNIALNEIKDKEIHVRAYDFKANKKILTPAKIFNTGNKPVFEITLHDGSKVKATKEHIFFVNENHQVVEKKLEELKKGDKLICVN